jgi:hypothetical protein
MLPEPYAHATLPSTTPTTKTQTVRYRRRTVLMRRQDRTKMTTQRTEDNQGVNR